MSLTIKLSDGIDPNHVTPGSQVAGIVTLSLTKQKTITNANISFTGKVVTEYSEVRVGSAGNTHGPRRHAEERINLFAHTGVFFPGPFAVPPQIFEWPFDFKVPRIVECGRRTNDDNPFRQNTKFANDGPCYLPPTFEWRDSTTEHVVSVQVKYKLVAEVEIGSGLFKRKTRQKLPITIPSFTSSTPPQIPLRSMSTQKYRWHSERLSSDWSDSLYASVRFPDHLPVPHPAIPNDQNGARASSPGFHNIMQLRIEDRRTSRNGTSIPQPNSTDILECRLTLERHVNLRVAPAKRLVRNVGTKMIASGGQGYTTDDVQIEKVEVVLPTSENLRPCVSTNHNSDTIVTSDYDLDEWFRAISDHLTQVNKARNGWNGLPKDKKRQVPIAGFKCYTVSVQYGVIVEFTISHSTAPNKRTCSCRVSIPIHLDGLLSYDIDQSELARFMAAQSGCTQEDMSENGQEVESQVQTKEQEAMQERSESTSHVYDEVDADLPRYEERGEAPPPV